MSDNRLSWLVRWSMIASLALFMLKVFIDLSAHPLVLATAGSSAMIYSILLILAVLIYAWFALFQTRISSPVDHTGLCLGAAAGLLCGAAWAVELAAANLSLFRTMWIDHALYYGTTIAAFLLPVLAGMLAGYRTGNLWKGFRAGLLCGMSGGLIIFLTALVFPGLLNSTRDLQTVSEFQHSGLPDMPTYIVGDTISALTGHLWIGIITGAVLGFSGGALGKAAARRLSS